MRAEAPVDGVSPKLLTLPLVKAALDHVYLVSKRAINYHLTQ